MHRLSPVGFGVTLWGTPHRGPHSRGFTVTLWGTPQGFGVEETGKLSRLDNVYAVFLLFRSTVY